ncbi:penicillin-binding protein 2 [Acidimicrobiaceae bacterium]|nr:penicillin-binding protein 2 [Acidimicrobiaceae bacterium]
MRFSRNRLKLNLLFLTIFSFVLFGSFLFIQKVYSLQFIESDHFQDQALSYRERVEVLEAKRGTIYDKHFNVLASSIQSYNVAIRPNEINDLGLIKVLSPILGIDENKILNEITENSRFFYLKRNVDFETGQKIKSWNYKGVYLEQSNKRNVYDESTSNLIGLVDPDGNGIEGLELYFDNFLQGKNGELRYESAPNGAIIPQGEIKTIQPKHGEDLVLAIDSELQYLTENLCNDALVDTGAFKCSVVFANSLTGEVLISSETSSLDNKYFDIDLISARANYEPGSALKIFTIGSLIESDIVDENNSYLVEDEIEIIDGSCDDNYEGFKGCFKDFLKHEPLNLTVEEIIERSSNVGTIKIVNKSNIDNVEEFLKKFGFGSKTGVELSGESKGSFTEYNTCKTCLSSLSIGYSINTTQYQMVKGYSIIANGGNDIQLSLLRNLDQNVNQKSIISNDLSNRLKKLLINVVEGDNGTGKSLRMSGYVIGGKTGTSRTYLEGIGYSDKRFNTSFTGFIETNEGPIVGSVILWGALGSPISEYVTGGSTAAPIFKNIVRNLVPDK